MSREEILIAGAGIAMLLLVVLLAYAFLQVARVRREVADLRAALDRRTTTPAADLPEPGESTYVIATFAEDAGPVESVRGRVADPIAEPIDGRLFADIVARETVVKAGSLIHGLRRALDPETRHRIRFEMKREVKRARKQRRADLKAALRDVNARARAEGDAA